MQECVICTEPIYVYSITHCNHNEICFDCSLRSRVVYGKNECPLCREENNDIIFDKKRINFEETRDSDFKYVFPQYGIKTNDKSIADYISFKIIPRCKFCKKEFESIELLDEHYQLHHSLSLCPICMKSEKVFVNEHHLYTKQQLLQHCNEINPQTKLKTHPVCQFCNEMFMDLEALNVHLNKNHEQCYICAKRSANNEYFKDYESLFIHFQKHHHCCNHPSCHNEYMAFETEEELTIHTAFCHSPKGKKVVLGVGSKIEKVIETQQPNPQHIEEKRNFKKDDFPQLAKKTEVVVKASSKKTTTTAAQRRKAKIIL